MTRPDRQGMTEIRYVEGHYAMWDAMIASKPGLFIDNLRQRRTADRPGNHSTVD